MGNTRDTQYSRDAQAHADQLAAPSRSLTTKAVVLAAVLALIAAVAFVGAMGRDANAYIPYEAKGNGNHGKANVVAQMTSPTSYPQNGSFNYEGNIAFNKLAPKVDGEEFTFTVTADPKAPFDKAPGVSAITTTEGVKTPIEVVSSSRTSVTYKLTRAAGADTVKASFSAPATLKSDVGEARVVYGSINGKHTPSTKLSLEGMPLPELKFPDGPLGQCEVGTAKFNWTLPQGGYLMDLKFADAKGDGSIEFKGPAEITYEPDPGNVHAPTYLENDPTPPYYGDADPIVAQKKNARWIDSYNWKYDPSWNTGETWLPAGTVVKVERPVKYTNCLANNSETIIGVLEIGKNAVPIVDSAIASFVTPGTFEPPATCTGVWNSNGRYLTGSTSPMNYVGRWKGLPDNPTWHEYDAYVQNEAGQALDTHAIAASSKGWLDGKLWYLTPKDRSKQGSKPLHLAAADLSNPAFVSTDWLMEGGPVNGFSGALAFDQNGVVYAFEADSDEPSLWRANIFKKETRWEKIIDKVEVNVGRRGEVKDFVVNSDGSITAVTRQTFFNVNNVFTIPAKVLKTKSHENSTYKTYAATIKENGKDKKGTMWGMAYDRKGNLLISQSDGVLYKLIRTSPNSSGEFEASVQSLNLPGNKIPEYGSGDLASCNFGDSTELEGATSFRLEKSAVDPVTGGVADSVTGLIQDDNGNSSSVSPVTVTNGEATVNYVVSMKNIGNKAGTPKEITDTFTAPNGFTVESISIDGGEPFESTTFTLPLDANEEIPSQGVKSFLVTVKLKVVDFDAVASSQAQECTTNNRESLLYNKVSSTSDETENDDDACIPFVTPETGKLRLIKQIVDHEGEVIDEVKGDASAFQLTAGTPFSGSSVTGFTGAGEVPDSGFKTVERGTYQLSEGVVNNPEAQKIASKYIPYSGWMCKTGADDYSAVASNKVEVGENPVTCRVQNTPARAKIQKFPMNHDEGEDNPHVGSLVKVSDDGSLSAEYKIVVTSAAPGESRVDSGPVFEQFTPPAGLTFASDAKATVKGKNDWVDTQTKFTIPAGSYVDGTQVPEDGERSVATGVMQFTADQFADGVMIARNVSQLRSGDAPKNGGAYRYEFHVSIPLKVNDSLTSDGTSTVFLDKYETLNKCNSQGSGDLMYVDDGKGIFNSTSLLGEDQTYSDNWEKDNHACVPVNKEDKWKVEKSAATGDGFAEAGTAGDAVTLTDEGKRVEAKFRVRVTNIGGFAAHHPDITDNITLNGGFKVESVSAQREIPGATAEEVTLNNLQKNGSEASFTIPKSESDKVVQTGENGYVDYIVTVVGTRETAPSTQELKEIGECKEKSGSLTPDSGLFNQVTMDGDKDGASNNKACVPVKPSDKKIKIRKFDASNNALAGAEFAIYPDNGGKANTNGPAVSVSLDQNAREGEVQNTYTSGSLKFDTVYWLKETKAPSANELLPQPVKFKLTTDGIQIFSNGSDTAASTDQDGIASADGGAFKVSTSSEDLKFTIDVHDPRAMELPKSGGMGRWPMVGVGVLLFMLSTLYMMKTSGVSRRRD